MQPQLLLGSQTSIIQAVPYDGLEEVPRTMTTQYEIRDTILCGVSRCAGYLAPLVSRTLRLSWPMESKQLPKQHRIGYICTESHNFIGYSFSTFRPLVVVVVRTTAGYNHGPTALPTKALSRSSRTEAAMDLLQRLAIITILVDPLTTA